MSFFYSIFGLLILLGILVTFHEWGHYWVAKKLGVKAARFSVGFGKPFWSKYNKEGVEFAVAPIPLGGYVKFVDEQEGNVSEQDLPFAFNRAPVWKRILIVLAGPAANFLLAILLYAGVYMMGIAVSKPFVSEVAPNTLAAQAQFPKNSEILAVNGVAVKQLEDVVFALVDEIGNDEPVAIEIKPVNQPRQTVYLDVKNWKEPAQGTVFDSLGLSFGAYKVAPVIGYVQPDSAADKAGLQAEDRILSIDGKPIAWWSEISESLLDNYDKAVAIEIERDGSTQTLMTRPALSVRGDQKYGVLGVSVKDMPFNTIQYGFFESLQKGTEQTWLMMERIVSFLGKLFTGKLSIKNLGGPVGIAQGAGQMVQAGMVAFLLYLAMISVNLGFVNLLPIPMLDGGHLMYYLAELVRGKPVSEKIMELGMRIGIILLLTIMAIALYNDINRI
ncbi:RIP metalloprotease RseP [Kangiella sp. TOML190]|uniref:RIP metalloprotease RseP n=1 Tax=Kangiella sp. TOML190 TaxID=2931351 RepID=UPI00204006A9|nr:RIP metalloprotease RseP [Kangiella sp. TOML190]